MKIINLNNKQIEELDECLEEYNKAFNPYQMKGKIQLGIEEDGKVVAGLFAYMTCYKILYLETLFVSSLYRRKGYGKRLMEEMEKQAKEMGTNIIRLDTFDWQGKNFYLALGYEVIGKYGKLEDGYEEYFFIKYI